MSHDSVYIQIHEPSHCPASGKCQKFLVHLDYLFHG